MQTTLHHTCGAVAHENRSVPVTQAMDNAIIFDMVEGFHAFTSLSPAEIIISHSNQILSSVPSLSA